MAQDKGRFRGRVFGGFDRKDVITYIESLAAERNKLRSENEALNGRIEGLEERIEALASEEQTVVVPDEGEAAEVLEEIAEERDRLCGENEELCRKIEGFEERLADFEARLASSDEVSEPESAEEPADSAAECEARCMEIVERTRQVLSDVRAEFLDLCAGMKTNTTQASFELTCLLGKLSGIQDALAGSAVRMDSLAEELESVAAQYGGEVE